jgi:hypothetical protein
MDEHEVNDSTLLGRVYAGIHTRSKLRRFFPRRLRWKAMSGVAAWR